MSKSFLSLCLLRGVYPIALTACVCCRQDLLTSILLLFLLYVPFVPVPTSRTMCGHTGIFLKFSFFVCVIMLLLQVAFQIVMMTTDGSYALILNGSCSELETLFRHLGFIRYDSLPVLDCVLHIAPEVVGMFASFVVYMVCNRLNPKTTDTSGEQGLLVEMMNSPENSEQRRSLVQRKALIALTIVGKYLSLIMLCAASILVPSVTTGVIYLIFLGCTTYWACYKDLNRGFAILCRLICVILFFYVFAIFCYQTQWIQELLPANTTLTNYAGLQALRLTNCTLDPRIFIINGALRWPSFALPFALIALYFLLIFESRMLFFMAEHLRKQPEGMTRQITTRLSQKGQKSSLFRNKTNRWRIATRQVRAVRKRIIEECTSPSESTPLIRGRESVYKRSANTALTQDVHGSITLDNIPDEKAKNVEENEVEESLKVDIMEYLVDAFITVVSFIHRTSYIGTNIIMMTWSITYHSWLTFFLLLGAIILCMVPNQRRTMLRLSPFIVFYAEFLLVSQFVMGFAAQQLLSISIGFDMTQLGFTSTDFPVAPLAIKTLFTTMFWLTMRQYMRERQESRSTSTVAHMMAPVHVTVGTATAIGGDPASKGGQIIQKFGEKVRKFLTKFWIWVVTITLFAIGVTGKEMTLFRITYTALALIFIITFQLSWVIWRKMMYGFWLTVIIISMTILVLIYTFQFKEIEDLWLKLIDQGWLKYIGLERYETSELFFLLLIPTFFVIITVIQLKYFHKDFLQISDIKSRGTSTVRPSQSRPSYVSDDEYATQIEDVSSRTEEATISPDVTSADTSKTVVISEEESQRELQLHPSRPSFHVFGHAPNFETLQTLDKIKIFVKNGVEVAWLFLELHIRKLILLLVMVVSISQVNAIHFGFACGAVAAMMLNSKFQDIVIRLMSVCAAVVLLAEMIYQIKHFNEADWAVNCTYEKLLSNVSAYSLDEVTVLPEYRADVRLNKTVPANITVEKNGAVWLGFYKTHAGVSVVDLVAGYIWIIVAVTLYVVVIARQRYVRHLRGRPLSRPRTLFPRISYREANKDVAACVKYLLNFGFYRFGVEITLISMVILIGIRLDLCALIYAFWLLLLVTCTRQTLSRIWYFFNMFVAITIPLQYLLIVGLPPKFCCYLDVTNELVNRALTWISLVPFDFFQPDAHKLIFDFLVLLFVTRQTKVFRIEHQHRSNDYPGGSNKSIIHEMENPSYVNPIPDFISEKRSYLDIIKHAVFCSLLWICCVVAFLAGTYSVTLFSLGYAIGSFLILWQGNDFYLQPVGSILKWWNRLLTYNVFVIFCKALFQIPGCIFLGYMEQNACGIAQLLGITCLKEFTIPRHISNETSSKLSTETCSLANDPVGMGWDVLCFILLIFQKRLFSSHYFVRIVDEAKAMALLAARGAELIEELSKKQIQKQQELEKTILQKIKNKMDSIKAAQKKIQGIKAKEPTSHQEERQAPLAHDTTPSISSAQGFHTPVEDDDFPTESRPNSYLQPPSPTSIVTVSLEGYMEPKRMSFGSPPMSHRPFSFDESYKQLSPQPTRRRSTLHIGVRRSLSVSSHHTSVRSGDYYMFDDEENQNLLQQIDDDECIEEDDEDLSGKTLGKLMETVMKTDVKRAMKAKKEAARAQDESASSKVKTDDSEVSVSDDDIISTEWDQMNQEIKEFASAALVKDDKMRSKKLLNGSKECSTCQFKSTDATTSKDVTDSIGDSRSGSLRRSRKSSMKKKESFKKERKEGDMLGEVEDDSSDVGHESFVTTVEEDSNTLAKCWDSFITYFRFALAFIEGCMVSVIQFLNKKSRDYRYVIQALEKEKKALKETRNLRVGMRMLPDMKWQPIPSGLTGQHAKSPLKIEDFESQGLVASDQPVFVRLLLAVYHALMSHSDMVCYFAVFILQIRSPTLTSLPLSLMVFFWGTLSMPRPTKRFWVTIIAYTEFVVVMKSACQSELFRLNKSPIDNSPFAWTRMLGIEKDNNDAIYNLILLLAVFFHRSTLKSLGLWKSAEEFQKDNKASNMLNLSSVEPQRSSVASSEGATEITTVQLMVGPYEVGQSSDSYQNQPPPQLKLNSRSISDDENPIQPLINSIKEFFSKVLDSTCRIADDVYAYMFFCDFCNIIVIIFGFSSFGSLKGDGGVTQYIEENKIPFAFLAMLILQFALIVVDRWLYLSKYIFGKLVFQYILVAGVHIWMFFILPAVTDRQFNAATAPSLYYLIKCCYLLLSAYQIRSGYPTRILGNFLCKNYNLVNMVLFKIFMLIPFVYELRTLMDWIWTETSMTLGDWIKMEDIFAQIFQLKCTRRVESKYPLPRSQKIAAKTKFIFGGGSLVTLFAIIWFPLVLFSLGDTVGEPNIPLDMGGTVQVSSYQPIYSGLTSKIISLTEDRWSAMKILYKDSESAQNFLSDYNADDVGVIFLPHYSNSMWTIPPPEYLDMEHDLNNTELCNRMKVKMDWKLDRLSENPESPKTVSDSNEVSMTNETCTAIVNILAQRGSNGSVKIDELMPKFLKITSPGKASPVAALMRLNDKDKTSVSAYVALIFTLEKDGSNYWWNAREDQDSTISDEIVQLLEAGNFVDKKTLKTSLIVITFNDKMFPPGLLSYISGKGIIGLYTTFVIFVGAFIKGYFTGTYNQIMFEDMPFVDRILQLCLDIFLVRERREFDLEEDLFAKLLFLYRSPETMIKWTRPPEEGESDEY